MKELTFPSVPSVVKSRLEATLKKLPKDAGQRKAALIGAFEKVPSLRLNFSTKEYFRMRLAQEYAKLVK